MSTIHNVQVRLVPLAAGPYGPRPSPTGLLIRWEDESDSPLGYEVWADGSLLGRTSDPQARCMFARRPSAPGTFSIAVFRATEASWSASPLEGPPDDR
jgi:hypothetical protein